MGVDLGFQPSNNMVLRVVLSPFLLRLVFFRQHSQQIYAFDQQLNSEIQQKCNNRRKYVGNENFY